MTANSFEKKGAEAELKSLILDGENALSKRRISKGYRNPILDEKIRKLRTRSEAKLLREAGMVVNVPKIIKVDEAKSEIVMEFIDGVPLKQVIEKNPSLCVTAGEGIKKLHDLGIIHGDLTTSNIIFLKKPKTTELKERVVAKGSLFFIDFGLGFFSKRLEDCATDLVVFKKTFNATHSKLKNGWELVMKGYSPSAALVKRIEEIEKRARYH
jgi:Kae1-associated kinase Bud32